jgi:hypothetical protein
MKIVRFIIFSSFSPFFKFRHHFFEIYHRSISIKRLKKNSKKFIPDLIFNYFKKRKLRSLAKFPETFSIETVNICNAKCWFCPQPDHVRKKDTCISIHIKKLLMKSIFIEKM